ncbi:MAG TPA: hypothetical protein DE315_01575 [Candidatus Omnitrophica bacterium]|nr:hypothetical protein [Candidatus Omnitrophota bacterium]HCI44210.1 hypothetical protein [Candidatus Omnitrophota bacterium]
MSVYSNSCKTNFVIIALATAITALTSTTLAEEMPMGDFHAKFQEVTGKTWETAGSAEKRDFVREYHKTSTETLKRTKLASPGEEKITSTAGDQSSNLKREATVKVRKEFLKKNDKDWDDATAEEQEAFLKEYKVKMREEMRVEQQKAAEDRARQQEKESQKRQALFEEQQRKQEKEFKKMEEERALKEKKDAEKQRLEEAFRKFEETRQKMREKRGQQ